MGSKMTDEEKTVFVGQKKLANYINAVLTQFEQEEHDEIFIKARGRTNVGKAVDLAEIAKNRYEAEIAKIETETNKFTDDEGEERKVSGIEIKLEK